MRIALFTDTYPRDLNGVATTLGKLVKHGNRGDTTDRFKPYRRSHATRERLAPGSEFIIAYGGTLAPEKRVEVLLEAFRHMRKSWVSGQPS